MSNDSKPKIKDIPMRSEKPEKWFGPSLAVWVYSNSQAKLFASGYYKELFNWEQHSKDNWSELLSENMELTAEVAESLEDNEHVLIEIDKDDKKGDEAQYLGSILYKIVTDQEAEDILSVSDPGFDSVSPTANKLPDLPPSLKGYELLDLANTNFPNNTHHSAPLSFCRRRCRLLISDKVTLCVWESPIKDDTANWETTQQRWPHHGIPGCYYQINRSVPFGHLAGQNSASIYRNIAPLAIIERIAVNEDYGLSFAFKANLELLQNLMFKMLNNSDKTTFEGIIEGYELLSQYLGMARENHTRLKGRLEVSGLKLELEGKSSYYSDNRSMIEIIESIDKQISKGYDDLLKLAKFIPTLQNELSKKFRQYASSFAIIFSVITIAVAIYGENLREVSSPNNNQTWILTGILALIFFLVAILGVPIQNFLKNKSKRFIKKINSWKWIKPINRDKAK